MLDLLWLILFIGGLSLHSVPDLFDLPVPFTVRVVAFGSLLLAALLQIGYFVRHHRRIARKFYYWKLNKITVSLAFVFSSLAYLLPQRTDRLIARSLSLCC